MAIQNSLDLLVEPTRTKVSVFYKIIKSVYPNFRPFETLRSLERQKQLVKSGASWTLQSLHRTGKAVDRVFLNKKWQPTWSWDYKFIQRIAPMCWLQRAKWLNESCHTEENGNSIKYTMSANSSRRKTCWDKTTQDYLSKVNTEFRKLGILNS